MKDENERYRLKGGRVLTEADLNALADEAERGYDPARIGRRPGRPRMGSAPAVVVPVRLQSELSEMVKRRAAAERTSVSDLVRHAVALYLQTETPGQPDWDSAKDAEILVAEAEAGYAVSSIRPGSRTRGRSEVVPVRVPPELKEALEARAQAEQTSVSEIVRTALRLLLDGLEPDPSPPSRPSRRVRRPTEADTNYVVARFKEAGLGDDRVVANNDLSDDELDGWLGDDPLEAAGTSDRLGRAAFASAAVVILSEVHKQSKSSVVALIGAWGSGKTTTLTEIKRRLQDDQTHADTSWLVIDFNPWHFQDLSSLQIGFFRELAASLPADGKWPNVRDGIARLGRAVAPLGSLIPGFDASKTIEAFADLMDSDEGVAQMQSKAEAALRDAGRPILVVLDDLDRLSPDELLLIFKLIRLTGRLTNLYYLTAFDEDSLLDALSRTGLVGSDDSRRALEYLEKIIQVRLDLPPVRAYQIGSWVDEALNKLVRSQGVVLDEPAVQRFGRAYEEHIRRRLSTPRAVKRFFGQAAAFLAFVKEEVDLVDYLLLTWIRTAEPLVYDLLITERDALLGTDQSVDKLLGKVEPKHEHDFWDLKLRAARVSDADVAGVAKIIGSLFPRFAASWNGVKYELGRSQMPPFRAHNPDYFDRYFFFGIPAEDLSDAVVRVGLAQMLDDLHGEERTLVEREFEVKSEIVLNKIDSLYDPQLTAGGDRLLIWLAHRYLETPETNNLVTPKDRIRWLTQRIFIGLPPSHALAVLGNVWTWPGGKTLASSWVAATARAAESSYPDTSEHKEATALLRVVKPVYRDQLRDTFDSFRRTNPQDIPDDAWHLLWEWRREDSASLGKFVRERVANGDWPLIDFLARLVPSARVIGVESANWMIGNLDLGLVDELVGLDSTFTQLKDELDAVTDPPFPEHSVTTTTSKRRIQALAQLRVARDRTEATTSD